MQMDEKDIQQVHRMMLFMLELLLLKFLKPLLIN
jgi:hypothetical protein